jgi:two-component system OmpR family sensor kinase
VIQVAQPVEIRERLAAHAGLAQRRAAHPDGAARRALIWWLAATQLAPLSRLAGELRARDAQSLAPLASGRLPDELAPLADSLNALLERCASRSTRSGRSSPMRRTSCARRSLP